MALLSPRMAKHPFQRWNIYCQLNWAQTPSSPVVLSSTDDTDRIASPDIRPESRTTGSTLAKPGNSPIKASFGEACQKSTVRQGRIAVDDANFPSSSLVPGELQSSLKPVSEMYDICAGLLVLFDFVSHAHSDRLDSLLCLSDPFNQERLARTSTRPTLVQAEALLRTKIATNATFTLLKKNLCCM